MDLIRKRIELENLEPLYDVPFTPESLHNDFEVRGGEWHAKDGWLIGRNPLNAPGMIISRQDFYGDVVLDFRAKTVLPSTHDIDVMWSGSWDEPTNTRSTAYVAGLEGWWDGKVGFEKSPDYKLNAATQYLNFEPGRVYHVQCGSIQGHLFLVIDGVLALELTDPDPIDTSKHGRVGFEAYCSQIAITDFRVLQAAWQNVEKQYSPEF